MKHDYEDDMSMLTLSETIAQTLVLLLLNSSGQSGEHDSDTLCNKDSSRNHNSMTWSVTWRIESCRVMISERRRVRPPMHVDGVLYRIMEDKTLRIIPPAEHRHKLFLEAHGGVFSAWPPVCG